jgi:DNA repair protein RecO (recombination protein O)
MKPQRSEAIILHTHPVRERDKLVVFLTADRGKRKGVAYGARSLRSRFGAALEPLAKVQLSWVEKESEELVRIESVDLVRSLFPAQQLLAASLAATYIAETVDTFAQAEEESELVFRLLDRACDALLHGAAPLLVVSYVEIWILKIGGVFPSVRNCIGCDAPLETPLRYEAQLHGFACATCSPRTPVLPNAVTALLLAVLRTPVEEFAAARPDPDALFELRLFARTLRRNFLGHELKSHDLLQAVLMA